MSLNFCYFNKSKIFTLPFILSTSTFTLLLGHHLLCGKHLFHKIKDNKTQQITNDLNTSDDNVDLTKSFSTSTELYNAFWGFEIFVFKISFSYYFLTALGQIVIY
jgi:hypothetical protein